MSTKISPCILSKNNMFLQAYVLLILGCVCLLVSWLIHPNTSEYPVGVMIFGFGMLIACVINPYRLVIASFLTTTPGIAVYLFFKHPIPGNEVLPEYMIAIGIGPIGIAFIGSSGLCWGRSSHSWHPRIGSWDYRILADHWYTIGSLTPDRFIAFMLSLWLPSIGLLLLGLTYLLLSMRK
jgi:hypothetical protein